MCAAWRESIATNAVAFYCSVSPDPSTTAIIIIIIFY